MVQSIDFHNYNKKDPDTYPSETGKYLIRYFPVGEEEHLPNYEIVWWIDEYKGFYYDQNCQKSNCLETTFDYMVFGWAFLPNMCNSSGKYPENKSKNN